MISVAHRAVTVRELVITLSANDARAILVALESLESDEDPIVIEFAEQVDAALRVGAS